MNALLFVDVTLCNVIVADVSEISTAFMHRVEEFLLL
jgi:hypothetical protein